MSEPAPSFETARLNRVYHTLSSFPAFSGSYTTKFLCIAFVGIHVPLLGIITYTLIRPSQFTIESVLVITLVLTITAAATTLFILRGLLSPLKMCKSALEQYLKHGILLSLPEKYSDEAGVLMQRVNQTLNNLDQLNEEKKDLIALLSHDLRTPLQSIQLLSRSIESSKNISTTETQEIASYIAACATEQMNLFENILELLRNEQIDRTQLKMDRIELNALIERAISGLRDIAKQKNISLHYHPMSSFGITVDPHLFVQVVKNLLSNAIKFSNPDSEVTIEVLRGRNEVDISINDNGVGFTGDESELMFQRFTNHRHPGTGDKVSSGMGLYLSRKIIRAHEGDIFAMSKGPNQGSVFTIRLPYRMM